MTHPSPLQFGVTNSVHSKKVTYGKIFNLQFDPFVIRLLTFTFGKIMDFFNLIGLCGKYKSFFVKLASPSDAESFSKCSIWLRMLEAFCWDSPEPGTNKIKLSKLKQSYPQTKDKS